MIKFSQPRTLFTVDIRIHLYSHHLSTVIIFRKKKQKPPHVKPKGLGLSSSSIWINISAKAIFS